MKIDQNPYHTPSYSTEPTFTCRIPIRTVSEANKKEHWSISGARHKEQKERVALEFKIQNKPKITTPCQIILNRVSPRFLDQHDNLRMSFKWILDAICEYITPDLAIGRADGIPGIEVFYFQEKGKTKEYAIEIQIYCR